MYCISGAIVILEVYDFIIVTQDLMQPLRINTLTQQQSKPFSSLDLPIMFISGLLKSFNYIITFSVFYDYNFQHLTYSGCAISMATTCETPIKNLEVNEEIRDELLSHKLFKTIDQSVDEEEHSLEMHMPYVAKILNDHTSDATIVPIMVGNLSDDQELAFAQVLVQYMNDPSIFFVISSDFCHWGSRFRYTPHDKTSPPSQIHEFIESMDREGMDLIQNQDLQGFKEYLEDTENTICGRNPIKLLLRILEESGGGYEVNFVKYDQSSPVQSLSDSSVSYASAIITKTS